MKAHINVSELWLNSMFCLLISIVFPHVMHAQCNATYTPDLPLEIATQAEIDEVNLIISRLPSFYGENPNLTTAQLNSILANANALYAARNITVNGDDITSSPVLSGTLHRNKFTEAIEFARYLRNTDDLTTPEAVDAIEKMKNSIGLVTQGFCNGLVKRETNLYQYRSLEIGFEFWDYLTPNIQNNLKYLVQKHSSDFLNLWPVNGVSYKTGDAYNTDFAYNMARSLYQLGSVLPTDNERVQWFKGMKRYLERYFIPSYATRDGLKPDGSAFHHWSAHPRYMYSYNTTITILYALRGTSYQVSTESYKAFRNGIAAHLLLGNDNGYRSMSNGGRFPASAIGVEINPARLSLMAIAGGDILGLPNADPYFAGMSNRIHGANPEFNYATVNPFESGYYQFNYANMGVFRKDGWVATFKGQSRNFWGTEQYNNQNHFGRYQAYGMFEIIYPGNSEAGNGYNGNKWNWNYNNNTTTIVYSDWNDLIAEKHRVDEYSEKRFVGSLAFKNKQSDVLSITHGTYGIFAMDFDEFPDGGFAFSTTRNAPTHNDSFVWKKSVFTFDDMIISLGSNITNNDTTNPTVTTLYQKLDNNGNPTVVNGTNHTGDYETTFSGSTSNWLIDNRNTGYYVSPGDEIKIWSAPEVTPNFNQEVNEFSNNPAADNTRAYINHGTNPNNKGFEYVVVPNASSAGMTTLHNNMQNVTTRPYIVHMKNSNAHIIEHKNHSIWGFAFFSALNGMPYDQDGSVVKGVDTPSIIMYQKESANDITLALTNPDVGLVGQRDVSTVPTAKSIRLTLHGEWQITNGNTNVNLVSSSPSETVLEFSTIHGHPYEIGLSESGNSVPVTGVSISPSTFSINGGDTHTLTETLSPSDATFKSVVWSSSDASIATVDSNGLVTGVSIGSATINVTTDDGDFTASSAVTVTSAPISYDYTETFENMTLVGWGTETYTGDHGFDWTVNAKGVSGFVNASKGIYFNKSATGVQSGTISGGVSSLSVSCLDRWSTGSDRIIELLINGNVVDTFVHNGTEVYTYTVNNINIAGDITIALRNASDPAGANSTLAIDDIRWNSYTAPITYDYTETFENMTLVGWGTETYTGDHGFNWTVTAKGVSGFVNASKGIYFNKSVTGVQSATISGGISSLSVSCLDRWFTGNDRTIELLINGNVVDTFVHNGTEVYTYTVNDINIAGDITIALRNASDTGANNTLAIDDIRWNSFSNNSSSRLLSTKTEEGVVVNDDILIYPNPVGSEVNIKLSSNHSVQDIYLLDVRGKTIFKKSNVGNKMEDLKIGLSQYNLEQGLYFIKIIESDKTKTVKILKK